MKKVIACLLLVALFVGSELQAQNAAKSQLRTWKDSTGQFSIQATYVRVNGDQVVLQRTDKKEISLPLAKLSAADQQYVKARQTLQEFGRVVFKGIQDLNTAELQALHLRIGDVTLLKERLKTLVTDPGKRALVGENKILLELESQFPRFTQKMNKEVVEFFASPQPYPEANLAKATYLGIVARGGSDEGKGNPLFALCEELGVDVNEAGVAYYSNPTIFFEVGGNVCVLNVNEVLLKLNHAWCLAGDAGFNYSTRSPLPVKNMKSLLEYLEEKSDYFNSPESEAAFRQIRTLIVKLAPDTP